MAISAQYRADFEKNYTKVCYQLLKEKLFVSFGLELTAMNVHFDDNSNFALRGKTFAYYSPIDDSLHVNIEDPFFTKCTSEDLRIAKMIFILFHEAYHKTLMHTERQNSRDHAIWNIAADYEVHNMLYLYEEVCCSDSDSSLKIYFSKIRDMLRQWNDKNYEADPKNGEYSCLFDENLLENIAEEIYQMIVDTAKTTTTSYSISLDKMLGKNQNQNQQPNNSGNNQGDSDSEDGNQEGDAAGDGDQEGNEAGEGEGEGGSSGKGSSDDDNQSDKEGKSGNPKNNQKTGKNSAAQASSNGSSGSGNNTVKVTETTYTLPNGKTHTSVSIQWPDQSQLAKDQQKSKDQQKADKDNRELRRQLMEQNIRQAAERNKGNISQKCEMFLKKLFKIKIDWEKILKSSLQTILSKSDYFTWAKPRTSALALDMYLPAICEDATEYGTLIVARDESGSMSDEEVAKCGAIIADAKEHYKKIIILKHDTEIQYEGEFEDLNDDVIKMLCTRATCGGTSHKDVFEYITEYWKKTRMDEEGQISCCIFLTDCCSDIQQYQDTVPTEIPMVYLVPEQGMSYTNGIRGKIIPIEM